MSESNSLLDHQLTGDSPELQSVLRAARLVAVTDVPLLISGENGTGKELLAKTLHSESRRSSKPFITVNCAALPDSQAESLLYGHRKGAFVGADDDHQGYIAAAHGGTLFLDEIGEASAAVQTKLLHFLESGQYQPAGHAATLTADVRVIAATNNDLQQLVQQHRFREDLYYRLNVVPLELPPLRERTGDVPVLLKQLTASLAKAHQLDPPTFSKGAVKCLAQYSWPGNVRELRNLCERMLVLFSGKQIEATNLPHEIRAQKSQTGKLFEQFPLPTGGISLDKLEKHMICMALEQTSGNRTHAARLLGLTRDTLLYRMKKHALRNS